ncbi:hypothetical protein T4D_1802 [Trichinella pseudospiralis]|uniref:Uncharacterized protein n=1 Tax=Trichinella pseudospiralis TaxID=6337 RepID=A0A0V1F9S1_TRIPS|nr:hypothetical protein T4D_1802 [Trichinella pseudospiralis]
MYKPRVMIHLFLAINKDIVDKSISTYSVACEPFKRTSKKKSMWLYKPKSIYIIWQIPWIIFKLFTIIFLSNSTLS